MQFNAAVCSSLKSTGFMGCQQIIAAATKFGRSVVAFPIRNIYWSCLTKSIIVFHDFLLVKTVESSHQHHQQRPWRSKKAGSYGTTVTWMQHFSWVGWNNGNPNLKDFRNDVWIFGHQEICELEQRTTQKKIEQKEKNREKPTCRKHEKRNTVHDLQYFFDLFARPLESERHFLFGPTPRAMQESILEAVF